LEIPNSDQRKLTNKITPKEIKINWSNEWPEFEGSEVEFSTIVGCAPAISLFLNYLGIATPQQRSYIKTIRQIREASKENI
jgi:hypothetical protein